MQMVVLYSRCTSQLYKIQSLHASPTSGDNLVTKGETFLHEAALAWKGLGPMVRIIPGVPYQNIP